MTILIFAVGFASGYLFGSKSNNEQPDDTQIITTNDITMKLVDAHPEGLNYRIYLCYTLPDARDWLLTSPFSLETTYILFNGYQVLPFEEGVTRWKYSQDGDIIEKCEYLEFYRPDLSFREITLVIDRLYAYETELSECEALRGKMTSIYNSVSLECMEVDGINGSAFVQIPLQVLDDRILKNQMHDLITDQHEGPWKFDLLNE